jgi:deazaflavin-dependent oxidoreductase (nitroreductase family)
VSGSDEDWRLSREEETMGRRVVTGGGLLLLGLVTLGVLWLLGMRDKHSVVVRTQRRVNRAVVNPQQMRTAGTPGADASIIRHIGRTSGRSYETPVGIVPTEQGFLVALVYGSGSDWLKNVLAAGSAVVVHEGRQYAVDRPEVVPLADVSACFPAGTQRSLRLFGVDECLRLQLSEQVPVS